MTHSTKIGESPKFAPLGESSRRVPPRGRKGLPFKARATTGVLNSMVSLVVFSILALLGLIVLGTAVTSFGATTHLIGGVLGHLKVLGTYGIVGMVLGGSGLTAVGIWGISQLVKNQFKKKRDLERLFNHEKPSNLSKKTNH